MIQYLRKTKCTISVWNCKIEIFCVFGQNSTKKHHHSTYTTYKWVSTHNNNGLNGPWLTLSKRSKSSGVMLLHLISEYDKPSLLAEFTKISLIYAWPAQRTCYKWVMIIHTRPYILRPYIHFKAMPMPHPYSKWAIIIDSRPYAQFEASPMPHPPL